MTPADPPLHPVPERAVPWAIARLQWFPAWLGRRIFGKPLAPTREEWRAVQQALWQGDAAMDQVVAWMFEGSPRDNRALFEQALMQGLDSIENPPPPLRDFFAGIDAPPAWLDPDHPAPHELLETPGPERVSDIVVREVPSLVNSVRNNGPELLDPVEDQPGQISLL